MPILLAVRSKAQIYCHVIAGYAGSNHAEGTHHCPLVLLCCVVCVCVCLCVYDISSVFIS